MVNGVIVHEWIEKSGGSEKVLDAMASAFPEADILCLWNNDPNRYSARFIKESPFAKTPLRRFKAIALPFLPVLWKFAPSRGYEWALVSSHLFAHHVTFGMLARNIKKFSYVHSPARYLWVPELDNRADKGIARLLRPTFREIDRRASKSSYEIAANSEYIRDRIKTSWNRDSRVIYPPVDVSRIESVANWEKVLNEADLKLLNDLPEKFVLGASRFIPYKRLDIVIKAGEAASMPVVIAGEGPEKNNLRSIGDVATVPVYIVEKPSTELLYAIFQRAAVYIFPPVEDFGIMPVEAMACGTPVVVNRSGGAIESVGHDLGKLALNSFDDSTLRNSVLSALKIDQTALKDQARKFSRERFEVEIREWIESGTKESG